MSREEKKRQQAINEALKHLNHILCVLKEPSGKYYCPLCKAEGKETETLKDKKALVEHLIMFHFDFYLGLNFGVEFTLRPLSEFIRFFEPLYKQKEIIDTRRYIR